jgi:Zn-dependent oligopeptidase
MNHKKAVVLLFPVVLALFVGTAPAQTQTPAPGASSLLAGTPESFLASCHSDLDLTKKQVADIKGTKSPRDAMATLQAFDTAILIANDAAARSGLAEQVHPAKPFRDAAQVCEQEASQLLTDISLDKDMYNVLASLDGSKLDSAGSYFLRTSLRDYHRSGVDRDDATRAKIRQLQDELVKIGQEFDQNIPADVRTLKLDPAQLDGLPEDFKQAHKPDATGKVTLKTDNTDYIPFREYATNEAAQKAFYELYNQRAYPKNVEVLSRLLQKRYELATVLGYSDWAAYVTEDKMVGTKQNRPISSRRLRRRRRPVPNAITTNCLPTDANRNRTPPPSTFGTTIIFCTKRPSRNTDTTLRQCARISNTGAFCKGSSTSPARCMGSRTNV